MRIGAIPAQKSSKRESKLDQNSNVDLAPKRAIRHSWSANWPKLLAWPEDPLIKIKPIFFDFLEIRTCSNSYLISLFLSILTSINRGNKLELRARWFLKYSFIRRARSCKRYYVFLLSFLLPLISVFLFAAWICLICFIMSCS